MGYTVSWGVIRPLIEGSHNKLLNQGVDIMSLYYKSHKPAHVWCDTW